jgi:hypothetical protein
MNFRIEENNFRFITKILGENKVKRTRSLHQSVKRRTWVVRRLNHIDNHCRQLPRWPWGHTDVRCVIEATLANTQQLPRKAQEALLLHLNIWNTHWPRGHTIYPSRRIIPDAKRERDASKEKKTMSINASNDLVPTKGKGLCVARVNNLIYGVYFIFLHSTMYIPTVVPHSKTEWYNSKALLKKLCYKETKPNRKKGRAIPSRPNKHDKMFFGTGAIPSRRSARELTQRRTSHAWRGPHRVPAATIARHGTRGDGHGEIFY